MGAIERARCPRCDERENVFVIAEYPGETRGEKWLDAWLECQECETVFPVREWLEGKPENRGAKSG